MDINTLKSITMETRSLFQLTSEQREIEEILWENGGELTPELEERMNDNQEALVVKADNYSVLIRRFGSASDSIDKEIKRLTALKKTADNAVKRLKGNVENCMKVNKINILEGSMTRFSFKKNPPSVLVDEEKVLSPYQKNVQELIAILPSYIKVTTEVSRSAIMGLKKENKPIPAGAQIVQGESLQMK